MSGFPSYTRFFRHASLIDAVCARVKSVLETKSTVKIHVCACSIGAEPISLAIRLHEEGLADQCEIIASDVSPDNISIAEAGSYRNSTTKALEQTRRETYFTTDDDDTLRYKPETAAPIQYEVLDLTETPPERFCADVVIVNNVFPKIEEFIGAAQAQKITQNAVKLLEDDQSCLIMFGEKPEYAVKTLKQAGLLPTRAGLLQSLIADEVARKAWSVSELYQILAKPDWLSTYGAIFAEPTVVENMACSQSLAAFNPELMQVAAKAIGQIAAGGNAEEKHIAICDIQPTIGGLRLFDLVQTNGGAVKRTYHAGRFDVDADRFWRIPYAVVNALPAQTRLRMFENDRPSEGVSPAPRTLDNWALSLAQSGSLNQPFINAETHANLSPNTARLFGPRDSGGLYPYKSCVDYGPISFSLTGEVNRPASKPYFPVYSDGETISFEVPKVEAEPRRKDYLSANSMTVFAEDLEEEERVQNLSSEDDIIRPSTLSLSEKDYYKLPKSIRSASFLKPSADYETFKVELRQDLPAFSIANPENTAPDIDLLFLTESLSNSGPELRKTYLDIWAERVKPGGLCIFLNDGFEPEIVEALRHKGLFAVDGGTLANPERIWSGSPSRIGQPYPKTISEKVSAHWLFAKIGEKPLLGYGDRSEPLIAKADNVTLSFPRHFRRAKSPSGQRFKALSDVSFDIRHGEILGIIGRNGAGKSTLLKVLAEVFRPDTGTLHVDGRSRLAALGLGLNLDLSGRDNINQMCAFLGLSRALRKAAEVDVIEFTQLGEFIDMPVRYYSSGMRARLSFAITTVDVPDLLLLDEVFATGDQDFAKASKARLEGVLSSAGAVVIVSHQMGVLRSLANRIVWLERGEVRAIGHPNEVVSAYLNSDRIAEDSEALGSPANKDTVVPFPRTANG